MIFRELNWCRLKIDNVEKVGQSVILRDRVKYTLTLASQEFTNLKIYD